MNAKSDLSPIKQIFHLNKLIAALVSLKKSAKLKGEK
jgi:hypothetical protein